MSGGKIMHVEFNWALNAYIPQNCSFSGLSVGIYSRPQSVGMPLSVMMIIHIYKALSLIRNGFFKKNARILTSAGAHSLGFLRCYFS